MAEPRTIDLPVTAFRGMTLNFGPQHPATHGTLRIRMELEGETIVKATPYIGFLHSGFEKLGEHLDFNQYVTVVDRMNYMSALPNDIAWHLAVERLFDVEVSKRCQYIRVVLAELSRIGCDCRLGQRESLEVALPDGMEPRRLFEAAHRQQVQIRHFYARKDTLEDIFLKVLEEEEPPELVKGGSPDAGL